VILLKTDEQNRRAIYRVANYIFCVSFDNKKTTPIEIATTKYLLFQLTS